MNELVIENRSWLALLWVILLLLLAAVFCLSFLWHALIWVIHAVKLWRDFEFKTHFGRFKGFLMFWSTPTIALLLWGGLFAGSVYVLTILLGTGFISVRQVSDRHALALRYHLSVFDKEVELTNVKSINIKKERHTKGKEFYLEIATNYGKFYRSVPEDSEDSESSDSSRTRFPNRMLRSLSLRGNG